ncbi:MAG: RNA polymerase sigma factor [Bacteroidetes bacterium]|nr:MAG: RNA polymerase sigma factor [Bacteroidota bacterium]
MESFADSRTFMLAQICQGNERVLSQLYETHRMPFIRWVRYQYGCDPEEASEIYQQAFVILYKNAKSGKMNQLKSSIRTYLYGIGKNLMYNLWRDRNRNMTHLEDLHEEQHQMDITYAEKDQRAHQTQWIESLMEQLNEKARQVLYLYYFANYSMEAIANALGYKSEKVAKKIKYDALQKLKKLARERKMTISVF